MSAWVTCLMGQASMTRLYWSFNGPRSPIPPTKMRFAAWRMRLLTSETWRLQNLLTGRRLLYVQTIGAFIVGWVPSMQTNIGMVMQLTCSLRRLNSLQTTIMATTTLVVSMVWKDAILMRLQHWCTLSSFDRVWMLTAI